jgi:hypothetical protein
MIHHARRLDGSTSRDVLAAGKRARCRVRRLARHGGYRWMFTLTSPTPVATREDAQRLAHDFFEGRRHDRVGGGARLFGGAYILVLERHPKGHGWHWHVLTNRRVLVQLLRVAWTDHLRSRGLLSVSSVWARVHAKEFPQARSAAAYAAKYVTKAVECGALDGHHRYTLGDNVEAPCPSYGLELGRDVWEVAQRVGQESSGALWTTARLFKVECPGPPVVWVGW